MRGVVRVADAYPGSLALPIVALTHRSVDHGCVSLA